MLIILLLYYYTAINSFYYNRLQSTKAEHTNLTLKLQLYGTVLVFMRRVRLCFLSLSRCFTMKLIDNSVYCTPCIMEKQKIGKTAPVTLTASSEIDLDSSSNDQSTISSSDRVSQVGNMSLRNYF